MKREYFSLINIPPYIKYAWVFVISLYNAVNGVSAYNTWINRLVLKVEAWNI